MIPEPDILVRGCIKGYAMALDKGRRLQRNNKEIYHD